ncbi:MAG: HAMP domain-containing sensor histidine kinase [Bacteroidota bacterium]
MNKKAIWAIIGLMSAAMIGIILLQVYWINFNIKLNEQQFDRNVKNAITRVAERLEDWEANNSYDDFMNAGMKTPPVLSTTNIRSQFRSNGTGFSEISITQAYRNPALTTPSISPLKVNNNLDFSYIRDRMEYQDIQKIFRPIEDRIDLKVLDDLLYQELNQRRGIEAKYNYGVFSNQTGSFVINNGTFAVVNEKFASVENVDNDLYNSSYQTELFSNTYALDSPGLLMVHFPNRTSLIWSSSWMTLLASIIFTGLILFCFSYTILVIFEQKKVSEMKTDFINNMTHEFKTPIATISLAADSITSPMISGNPNKVKRFADIIRQENKRMNNQVEKVLQMALIDKREYKLKMAQINLHDVVDQAVQNSNLQVEKKGGKVSTEFNATNPYVFGDVTHISNIINNLLDNANKYSPEKPEISVSTRNVAQGVEVIIKDNGIGMGREALKHIFDKFYRVHTGNRHDVKGFGLGLSYVKALIDAHKGTIDVKSELGKGSSFILVFPYNSVPQNVDVID